MANNLGSIIVEIKSDAAQLYRGLDRATQRINQFANKSNVNMKSLAVGIGAVTVGLGLATVAASKLIDSIFDSAKAVGNLYDNTQKLGVSVKAFQQLDFAAGKAGLSTEGLNNSLAILQRNIGAGIGGDKGVNQALKQIGLSINDLQGKSLDEQFKRIATGLKGIEEPAIRSKVAFELLGRGAKDAMGLINSDIGATIKEFDKLGISLTQNQAATLDTLDETKDAFGKVFDGFLNKVAANVAPAFTQIIQGLMESITAAGGLDAVAKQFGDFLIESLNNVIALGKAFISVVQGIGTAVSTVNKGFNYATAGIQDPNGNNIVRSPIKTVTEGIQNAFGELQRLTIGFKSQNQNNSSIAPLPADSQFQRFDQSNIPSIPLVSAIPSFSDQLYKSSLALEKLSSASLDAAKNVKQSAFVDLLNSGKGVDEQLKRIADGVDKNPVAINEDFDRVAQQVLSDLLAGSNPNGAKVQSNLGFLNSIANGSGRDGQDHTAQQKALEELYKFANKGSQQVDVNLKITPTPYAMIEWVNDPKNQKVISNAVFNELAAEAAASAQR